MLRFEKIDYDYYEQYKEMLQECKDYIEDKVFEYIEKFKTIKEIKNILK